MKSDVIQEAKQVYDMLAIKLEYTDENYRESGSAYYEGYSDAIDYAMQILEQVLKKEHTN